MLITQCYKDSPLSESGFCEWNPSLSILLGLPISKCCPRQSTLCGEQRLKHICRWACFSNLNKPRCAKPEVKRISMDCLGHYLVVACGIASGLVAERGSRDTETKACVSHHTGPCQAGLWLMLGQTATVCQGEGTVWQVDRRSQQETRQISGSWDCRHRMAWCVFSVSHSTCDDSVSY